VKPVRVIHPVSRSVIAFFSLLLVLGLAIPALAQPAQPPNRDIPVPPVRQAPRTVPAQPALPKAAPAPRASQAPRLADTDEYGTCVQLASSDPNTAYENAGTWIVRGGGFAARDCQALALIGLGSPGEAAQRLDALATDMGRSGSPDLPTMLAQAGQAWLVAGRPERAYAAQSAALKLTPDDVDLLIDRAVTLARAKNYREAVDDLSRALKNDPKRVDALVYRGTAYRFLDNPKSARADIDRALVLDPSSPDALLERGNLKRLTGDNNGARSDWITLLRQIPEQAPQAVAARANIEKLDLKVR
jgi:tetratricopeptide (TPR) repeat protein